jgi:hypothetical protein
MAIELIANRLFDLRWKGDILLLGEEMLKKSIYDSSNENELGTGIFLLQNDDWNNLRDYSFSFF